ncbi:PAS domain-containing protein, partial [Pseudanabaenaceae cyanobacterium LEGE 13415]|nr:PAS domain-containing protein [Pseudanabaenaceae cyanobacterium LEGE 13415]
MKFRRSLAYCISIGSTAIALSLSLLLAPLITHTIGAFFYIAIALATWYGGLRPGLLAVILSLMAVNYFFIPPLYQILPSNLEETLRSGLFLTVSVIITVTSGNLRTSRRRIEHLSNKLIAESDQRLKLALNAAQMGLWDWNFETGEIVWSPDYEQLFGLVPGSQVSDYATFEACLHPDDRTLVKQMVNRAIETRSSYQCEYRVRWADGSLHWLEGRGHAFYDESGNPIRMTGTVLSIDDRKQLEFALRQSEQQFRGIFEAEPECVKILTGDGLLQTINPAGLAMIEAENLEAIQGQSICPVLASPYRSAYDDFNRYVSQGNTAQMEYEIIGLKGTRRWLESHAVPLQIPDRQEALVLSVTRDITDRKLLELSLIQARDELEQRVIDRTAELSEVNARLLTSLMEQQHTQAILAEQAQLLDLAHDAILTLDLNWMITFWNVGAEAMYGFSKSEALG